MDPTPIRCAECQSVNPPQSRFCSRCGRSVAAGFRANVPRVPQPGPRPAARAPSQPVPAQAMPPAPRPFPKSVVWGLAAVFVLAFCVGASVLLTAPRTPAAFDAPRLLGKTLAQLEKELGVPTTRYVPTLEEESRGVSHSFTWQGPAFSLIGAAPNEATPVQWLFITSATREVYSREQFVAAAGANDRAFQIDALQIIPGLQSKTVAGVWIGVRGAPPHP
jgi:hypothetical protein